MTVSKTIKIAATLLVVAGAGILYIMVFRPCQAELAELTDKRDGWLTSNDAMAEEIAELRWKQVMFDTDRTFVGAEARDVGLLDPEEIVFIFPKE
ncbi:MAG: hypothetical protein FWF84_07250 [Kiritimatiellaeota bacterium]|nr:hypothetical protein [Kiritimatiellota bacterium]